MSHLLHKFAHFVSRAKGAKIVIICWLLAIGIMAIVAPGSSGVETSTDEGSIHEDTPSTQAQQILDNQFPSDDGLTALLVFHNENKISSEERSAIEKFSKWLTSDDKPENVASAEPFYKFTEKTQNKLFSDDGTTMQMHVAMKKGMDSDHLYKTLQKIQNHTDQLHTGNMDLKITGPAGITADTISLFKNADLVLMFATIGLILILLIIIYRSPLLAVIPLLIAGMVYMIVDRVLGMGGDNGWFVVDSQATSIMMILLFAVLTDYSLFILSRYRTALEEIDSKYEAMKKAFTPLIKPILFSGLTVLIAMIVLFFTNFKPYHHFAPVFSIAIVFILLSGITLIPAVFALVGRRAFWPFIPKPGEQKKKAKTKKGFWTTIANTVTKRPGLTGGILLLLLLLASVNIGSMKFSFNQLDSFPEDISSRQGFDLLADHFPAGKLAPVNVILKSNQKITVDDDFANKVNSLEDAIKKQGGIKEITPNISSVQKHSEDDTSPSFLSKQKQAIKMQVTLKGNPYDTSSLQIIDNLREKKDGMLEKNGLDSQQFSLHYAGQTANQLDVKKMNQRDTVVTFTLIAVLIAIMLIFQSRSVITGLIMIGTMLLSYTASLGLGWMVFHNILGYDTISYRLPLYTFVFLISLGVDYNIFLVSRIQEEALSHDWIKAISRGVSLTGGVISSAGIILAGTFTVLTTQPIQELFMFGLTMGMGILIDTFLVRGMLLPSILTFVTPKRAKSNES